MADEKDKKDLVSTGKRPTLYIRLSKKPEDEELAPVIPPSKPIYGPMTTNVPEDEIIPPPQGDTLIEFYQLRVSPEVYLIPYQEMNDDGTVMLDKEKTIDEANLAVFNNEGDDPVADPLPGKEGQLPAERFSNQPSVINPDLPPPQGLRATRLVMNDLMDEAQFKYGASAQEGLFATNRMRFRKTRRKGMGLVVDGSFIWKSFDTHNTGNFKITTEPDPDASEVTLSIGPGTVKVYLARMTTTFLIGFEAHYFYPYPLWREQFSPGSTLPVFGANYQPDYQFPVWGAGYDPLLDFENPYEDYNSDRPRSFIRHWNVKGQSSEGQSAIGRVVAPFASQAQEYFNILKGGGEGYTWFPLAYSYPEPYRLAIPRWWDDYLAGHYIIGGSGSLRTNQWIYSGKFMAGIIYKGQKYFVWRKLIPEYDPMFDDVYSNKFMFFWPFSDEGHLIEPSVVYTSETHGEPNMLGHYFGETDPARLQITYIEPSFLPGGSDQTVTVTLPYMPKRRVNFDIMPRRFQD